MSTFQRYDFKSFLSRYTKLENITLFSVLEELPSLSSNGPWLAGGAVRRTLMGDNLNSDFDFFFRDQEQFDWFRQELKKKDAKMTANNDHVETYVVNLAGKERIIQLIKISFYKTVEDVLDSFDFTITQFAYDGKDLITGQYSLWDLARKRLALHKLSYGVATLRRVIKYTNQGFTACTGVLQAILESVANNPNLIQSDVQYVD